LVSRARIRQQRGMTRYDPFKILPRWAETGHSVMQGNATPIPFGNLVTPSLPVHQTASFGLKPSQALGDHITRDGTQTLPNSALRCNHPRLPTPLQRPSVRQLGQRASRVQLNLRIAHHTVSGEHVPSPQRPGRYPRVLPSANTTTNILAALRLGPRKECGISANLGGVPIQNTRRAVAARRQLFAVWPSCTSNFAGANDERGRPRLLPSAAAPPPPLTSSERKPIVQSCATEPSHHHLDQNSAQRQKERVSLSRHTKPCTSIAGRGVHHSGSAKIVRELFAWGLELAPFGPQTPSPSRGQTMGRASGPEDGFDPPAQLGDHAKPCVGYGGRLSPGVRSARSGPHQRAAPGPWAHQSSAYDRTPRRHCSHITAGLCLLFDTADSYGNALQPQ